MAVLAGVGCREAGRPLPSVPPTATAPPWGQEAVEVPQLTDLDAVFDVTGSPPPAMIASVLLVCRVDVTVDDRDVSRPDQAMFLEVGTRAYGYVRPPYSNTWTATVAWPVANLLAGQRLRIRVWDKDTFSNDDLLATFEVPFTGTFPLVANDPDVAVECRALTGSALQARLAPALAHSDTMLDVLAGAAPADVAAGHLALPRGVMTDARQAISGAAALVGWEDARVATRVTRSAAIEHAWTSALQRHADGLARALPAPGAAVPVPRAALTLTAAPLECDAARMHAALQVDEPPTYDPAASCLVTYTVEPSAPPAGGASAAAERVRTQLVTREGQMLEPVWQRAEAPDATGGVRVRFLVPVDPRDQAALWLARVTVRGQPTLVVRVK